MRLALIDLDTNALITTDVDLKTQVIESEKLFQQLSANYIFLLESYLQSYKHVKLSRVNIECLVENRGETQLLKISKELNEHI